MNDLIYIIDGNEINVKMIKNTEDEYCRVELNLEVEVDEEQLEYFMQELGTLIAEYQR